MFPYRFEGAEKAKRIFIKSHWAVNGKPWCRVQTSMYQPPKMTDQWTDVTCQRCIDKWMGTGVYAGKVGGT